MGPSGSWTPTDAARSREESRRTVCEDSRRVDVGSRPTRPEMAHRDGPKATPTADSEAMETETTKYGEDSEGAQV